MRYGKNSFDVEDEYEGSHRTNLEAALPASSCYHVVGTTHGRSPRDVCDSAVVAA